MIAKHFNNEKFSLQKMKAEKINLKFANDFNKKIFYSRP